jgi:hypothetical protein
VLQGAFDGTFRDADLEPDLFVRLSLEDATKHLLLACGQTVPHVVDGHARGVRWSPGAQPCIDLQRRRRPHVPIRFQERCHFAISQLDALLAESRERFARVHLKPVAKSIVSQQFADYQLDTP